LRRADGTVIPCREIEPSGRPIFRAASHRRSSPIFDHEPESEKLTVLFKNGRVYVYRQVPEDVFLAVKTVRSKGTFFNDQIRNRYRFEDLADA
jgi:hypothetical protein